MTGVKTSPVAAGLISFMAASGAWALWHVNATARLPIHFDLAGHPDGYAPAWLALFILPAIGAVIWLLPVILPHVDPRGENLRRSGRAIATTLVSVTFVLALAQAMVVCAALGKKIDTTHLVGAVIGGLFIAIGNVFGKLRWNYTVGIRTPWTIANEQVWDRTHRFGGWVFVVGGVMLAVLSFALSPPVMMPVLLGVMVVIVALPVLRSYTLWLQLKQ